MTELLEQRERLLQQLAIRDGVSLKVARIKYLNEEKGDE